MKGSLSSFVRRAVAGLKGWAVLAVLLLSSCASMKTGVHFDEQYDFAGMKTFTWLSDEPAVIPPDADPGNSPLLHRYIKEAIRDTFEEGGFRWVEDRADADFLVGYLIGSRDRIASSTYSEVYQGRSWFPDEPGTYMSTEAADHQVFRESTLSVDVFAAATQQPIWHGWATRTITDADRSAPRAPVREAISQILAPFPP
ncbi:MAG: DUF4136 domain-containing protein [Pseudomonadota bacterium]